MDGPLGFVVGYGAVGGGAAKGVGVVSPTLCVLDHGPMKGIGGVEVVVFCQGGEDAVFTESGIAEPESATNGFSFKISDGDGGFFFFTGLYHVFKKRFCEGR